MSRARASTAAVLALLACTSCPMLGTDEETFAGAPADDSDRIPVVDDVGPFDPREAVDDDDGTAALADQEDPTDRSAFAAEDARDGAEPGQPRAEPPPASEGGENERSTESPQEAADSEVEPIAAPAEVAAEEAEQRAATERAEESAEDEDQAKAEASENPPPEPAPESERLWGKTTDFALETLLVAIAALLLTSAIVYARTHVKTVAIGSVVLLVLALFVSLQIA